MSKRLLIVDDERDMLDFIERVFRREYQIVRAESVEDALSKMGDEAVDVLITDRRMPRRSGLELIQIVADRQPATVRVLLTGYADSLHDMRHEQLALVDAWISKPIDSGALRKAVYDAIDRRAGGLKPST